MNSIKHYISLFACLLFFVSIKAQTDPDKIKTWNLVVNTDSYLAKINVLAKKKKCQRTFDNRTYYWYFNNSIHQSKGSIGGKALHGEYISYYTNDQLLEKGKFINGLKHKKWIHWYIGGNIQNITHWKRGRQQGKYSEYFSNGIIKQKSNYRKGLLHGMQQEYNDKGELVSKLKYRKGEVYTPKEKKQKVETKIESQPEAPKQKPEKTKKVSKSKKENPSPADKTTEKKGFKAVLQKAKTFFSFQWIKKSDKSVPAAEQKKSSK